jgi:hypothetical protein
LIVVDFPAPFGPRNPKNCPGSTASSILSTAVKLSKVRLNEWAAMADVMVFLVIRHAAPPSIRRKSHRHPSHQPSAQITPPTTTTQPKARDPTRAPSAETPPHDTPTPFTRPPTSPPPSPAEQPSTSPADDADRPQPARLRPPWRSCVPAWLPRDSPGRVTPCWA